ncbi:MAG: hypothetical protein EZS28_026247, partial [Streblomastix strix]
MTTENELFEVLYEYRGRKGDSQFLSVAIGDIVRVIKKEDIYFIVDKDRTSTKNDKTKASNTKFHITNLLNHSMGLNSQYFIQYKPNINVAQHQMSQSTKPVKASN